MMTGSGQNMRNSRGRGAGLLVGRRERVRSVKMAKTAAQVFGIAMVQSQGNTCSTLLTSVSYSKLPTTFVGGVSSGKFRIRVKSEEIMAKLSEMVEIANPKQPHCATVLLLDISGSMDGSKLKQLNDGLRSFKDDIFAEPMSHPGDELAKKRVDLAMVTFSSDVKVIQDFTNMDAFEPPTLQAGGTTAMGEGIRKAIELIERRKSEYKAQGTDYYRPWILLITDGEPHRHRTGTIRLERRRAIGP